MSCQGNLSLAESMALKDVLDPKYNENGESIPTKSGETTNRGMMKVMNAMNGRTLTTQDVLSPDFKPVYMQPEANTRTAQANGVSFIDTMDAAENRMAMPQDTTPMTDNEELQRITPTTEPPAMTLSSIQYLNGALRTQIGSRVLVQFLIGTNTYQDRSGILLAVGADYIIINETDTDDILFCDFYTIKFVKVFK